MMTKKIRCEIYFAWDLMLEVGSMLKIVLTQGDVSYF